MFQLREIETLIWTLSNDHFHPYIEQTVHYQSQCLGELCDTFQVHFAGFSMVSLCLTGMYSMNISTTVFNSSAVCVLGYQDESTRYTSFIKEI